MGYRRQSEVLLLRSSEFPVFGRSRTRQISQFRVFTHRHYILCIAQFPQIYFQGTGQLAENMRKKGIFLYWEAVFGAKKCLKLLLGSIYVKRQLF